MSSTPHLETEQTETSDNREFDESIEQIDGASEYQDKEEAEREDETSADDFVSIPILELDDDDESNLLPDIERDTKLEAEVEAEATIPVERIVDDVSINDPVRQYLREIGRMWFRATSL